MQLSGQQLSFAVVLVGWIICALLGMALLGVYDVTAAFLLVYPGFLTAVEFSEWHPDRPEWHRRLDIVSGVGAVIFLLLVVDWTLSTAGQSLV